MIDLQEMIKQLSGKQMSGMAMCNVIRFLVDNEYFGVSIKYDENHIYVEENQREQIEKPLRLYFDNVNKPVSEKIVLLMKLLSEKWPATSDALKSFFLKNKALDDKRKYAMLDIFTYAMHKEVIDFDNQDLVGFMTIACDCLPANVCRDISDFFSWVKSQMHVKYTNEITIPTRGDRSSISEAYDENDYLELYYYIFNEEYHERIGLWSLLARDARTLNAFLYMSLHLLKPIRDTDLVRIPYAKLDCSPQSVITEIENGTFSDSDSVTVLETVVTHMQAIKLSPNKTKRIQGVGSIKFTIPRRVQSFMGKLFALRAANHLINQESDEIPIVQRMDGYPEVKKYLPIELAELLKRKNFRSIAATKSYLQEIQALSDSILNEDGKLVRTKGYILAALARSHKGGIVKFASSTLIYLKDSKFTDLSIPVATHLLLERGTCSFIPSMLLRLLTSDESEKLPVTAQTQLISCMDLTPAEIELACRTVDRNYAQAIDITKTLLDLPKEDREKTIKQMLFRIGNAEALSREEPYDCLLSALGKCCPFDASVGCGKCDFHILKFATLFYLMDEYKRLKRMYKESANPHERTKAMKICSEIIIPLINEIVLCAEQVYGKEASAQLYKIVQSRK